MEKNLLKKIAVILFSVKLISGIFAQTPSVIYNIRFPIWAEIDAYPGSEAAADDSSGDFDYPVKRIREVAPFIVSGMVYGWEFVYTPSDKSRGVEEFFEITEIHPLDKQAELIHYTSPWIENERLNCWCEYTRSDAQVQSYYLWSSIQNPVIHGVGEGDLSLGFDGIKLACEDALKNAVREYYRKVIKNKPKEITGAVLVREIPTVGIKSGRYIINLDFFLECGKIKEYIMY